MFTRPPLKSCLHLITVLSCLALAGCVSSANQTQHPPSPQSGSVTDGSGASVLRTGYRWAKAGPNDQIVIPPERFVITGVDETPLDRDGRMLNVPAGFHLFDVVASGGPFRGTGQIKARLHSGADYQLTGFLDNRGSAAFIVWLEDTLTHQPASPRQRLTMSRQGGLN